MADRGTATFIPLSTAEIVGDYAPITPGGESSGPAIPTVGVIFPSGSA
jgi:hypothetical protein